MEQEGSEQVRARPQQPLSDSRWTPAGARSASSAAVVLFPDPGGPVRITTGRPLMRVPPAGLEPAPRGLKGRRSNQLSYRGEVPMVDGDGQGRRRKGIVPYSPEQYVQPVIRCASAIAATLLLLSGMIGCGSGGDETVGNPKRELARWYAGVEAAVADMEAKQRGFTRFRVDEPPAKNGLVGLSPAGIEAGEVAKGAAEQLDASTTLSAEEASGLYCYFFAFYVDLESSPDKEEFELVIHNLVKADLLPSASPDDVHRSADALREAMIAAEKAGARGGEVAAAVFC